MFMFTMLKQRSGNNMEIPKSFLGYKRENGRAGTRNHVIILPVDDISNACAEAVANNIKGTIALPHSYGRLQFGADLELHFRTMIGTGCNPNVAAVIVIGIEPKWTKKIVDGIAKTGKPVEGFHIERTGDIGTTMKASKKAQEYVMWASEKQREECPMSDLWISVKCGESDTTSGLAAKAAVKYIEDKKAEGLKVSDKQCEDFKTKVYKPLETYTVAQNEITGGTVSPSYISPIQGLQRLQRIMDEYVGGIATNYMTNANMLKRGLELLTWLEEDLENVGAEDYHQLMRAWELKHRALTSQCVTEHTMFREETRWPGYYYRGDHMKLDDDNWHCLTVSRRDPKTGKFSMEKVPVYHIVDENEKKKAS